MARVPMSAAGPTPLPVLARLTHAWECLRGERRGFHLVANRLPLPEPDDIQCVLLPLVRNGTSTQAAVGLVLGREQARHIAAAMFGGSPDALSESDVADACGEVCNVLTGCVIEEIDAAGSISIGLPQHLPAREYRAITLAGSLKSLFEMDEAPQELRVFVFNAVPGIPTAGGIS